MDACTRCKTFGCADPNATQADIDTSRERGGRFSVGRRELNARMHGKAFATAASLSSGSSFSVHRRFPLAPLTLSAGSWPTLEGKTDAGRRSFPARTLGFFPDAEDGDHLKKSPYRVDERAHPKRLATGRKSWRRPDGGKKTTDAGLPISKESRVVLGLEPSGAVRTVAQTGRMTLLETGDCDRCHYRVIVLSCSAATSGPLLSPTC